VLDRKLVERAEGAVLNDEHLEKDWYVVQAIRIISSLAPPPT
jgi:hypothetical protein